MKRIPPVFFILTAALSVSIAVLTNWFTDMWTPETAKEKLLVTLGFVVLAISTILASYISNGGKLPVDFMKVLRPFISPWWLVALSSLATLVALIFHRTLLLLGAMGTLFCLSVLLAVQNYQLSKRDTRKIYPIPFRNSK